MCAQLILAIASVPGPGPARSPGPGVLSVPPPLLLARQPLPGLSRKGGWLFYLFPPMAVPPRAPRVSIWLFYRILIFSPSPPHNTERKGRPAPRVWEREHTANSRRAERDGPGYLPKLKGLPEGIGPLFAVLPLHLLVSPPCTQYASPCRWTAGWQGCITQP